MSNFFRPTSYAVMVSPGLTHAWINIPKNCSSFCQKVFDDNGWTMCHTDDLVDGILLAHTIKKIVVLRDPVERWISGFSQGMIDSNVEDVLNLLDNPAFWQTLRFNPVFDDHTEYQHRFIGAAQNVKYINIQNRTQDLQYTDPNRFYRDLTAFIRSAGGTSEFQYWKEPTNPAENDPGKFAIFNKLHAIIKERKEYYNILKNAHSKDYELYNTLTKFET
jgi:hypothetical protein